MSATLQRKILHYFDKNPSLVGGALLIKALELNDSGALLRSVVGDLAAEEALWLKHFSQTPNEPLNFVAKPGPKFHSALQRTKSISFFAEEVLERIYHHSLSTKSALSFQSLREYFPDSSPDFLDKALQLLENQNFIDSKRPTHLYPPVAVRIHPRGIIYLEKSFPNHERIVKIMGDKIEISNSQGVNVAVNSPGAQQNASLSSEPTAELIRASIESALAILPQLDFPPKTRKKIQNALETAADSTDEKEQDLEHSLNSVNRALKLANGFQDQLSKLAVSLSPIASFLGQESAKYF